MKVKTSVSLSPELIRAIDELVDADESRSAFMERALWEHLRERVARERVAKEAYDREVALLNAHADYLNSEAKEVLRDAGAWWTLGDEFDEEDFVVAPR